MASSHFVRYLRRVPVHFVAFLSAERALFFSGQGPSRSAGGVARKSRYASCR